jgi:hypothetical protein
MAITEKEISVDQEQKDRLWLVTVHQESDTSFYVRAASQEVADVRARRAMPDIKSDPEQWFGISETIEDPKVYHLPVAEDELEDLDSGDNVYDGENWASLMKYQTRGED